MTTPAHLFAGLLDVLLPVDVLVGEGSITGRDCMQLRPSSVIRLRQLAGADLEVRVRGVTIATGEIVIVEESTAVRISEVAAPPGVEVPA